MTQPLGDTLRDLARELEHPPTPDIAGAVARRLAEHPPRRPLRTRRLVVTLVLVLALPAGALAASPPVRDALRDVLGIGAVKIERSTRALPALAPAGRLELGTRIAPGAPRDVRFTVVEPRLPALGDPDEVYVRRSPPGGALSFVYRAGSPAGRAQLTRRGLLMTQFRGTGSDRPAGKLLGPGTSVERVTVDGERGVWITGKPHGFGFVDARGRNWVDRLSLAGDTLLWQRGPLTLRLEGASSKAAALRVARSVR
jgi:hypothetical protein